MNAALWFLLLRTLRGRVVRTLRLLRQPKYLIGLLAFVLWIVGWAFGPMLGAMRADDDPDVRVYFAGDALTRIPPEALGVLHVGIGLVIALLVTLWWLAPWAKIALGLKEAEIELLLPTPLRRRHFIQYATLKSQPGILFGTLMMTVFLGSGGPFTRFKWFVSFWIFFSIWDFHSKGRSLFKARLREMPSSRAMAWRAALLLAIAVLWATAVSQLDEVVAGIASVPLPEGEEQIVPYLRNVLATWGPRLQEGALRWALAPFLWLTGPLVAVLGGELGIEASFPASLWIPLALLVAHNEWVVRSQVKFEEAALQHARRELRKKDARARYWKRSLRARRRTPFALPPGGSPYVGVLWKNLLLIARLGLGTVLLGGVGLLALFAFLPWLLGAPFWVNFALMAAGLFIMMVWPLAAPQSTRCDLRQDLVMLEVVRGWPLAGWKLFAIEAAGPAAVGFAWVLFGAGLVLAGDVGARLSRFASGVAVDADSILTPSDLGPFLGVPGFLVAPLAVLAILPLAAAVACLTAVLQNLAVLFFPGWVQLGPAKQQGAATFGQNIVVFFALSLALMLSFLPSVLVVGAIVLVQLFVFGVPFVAWEAPLLGILAAVTPLTAAALLVRAGGRAWDALDPSREILDQAA